MVAGGGICLFVSLLNRGKKTETEEALKEKELTERLSMGAEIGRIPGDSVDTVTVGDKARVAQQRSAQERACLGKTSSSRKATSHCLVLRWENSDYKKHAAIFEFAEQASADAAAQELQMRMKPDIAKAS
jgi:hypothetical protein